MFFYKKYKKAIKGYHDELFYGSIGRLTISWTWLEANIDLATIDIYRGLNQANRPKNIPLTLKDKLKFLKKSALTIKTLEPIKDQLLALIEKIQNEIGNRHDIIHGNMNFNPKEINHQIQIARIIWEDIEHAEFELKESEITTKSIMKQASLIRQLSHEFSDINEILPKFETSKTTTAI